MRAFNPTTTAFNVERMRAELLERVRPPADLLQRAIDKVHEKLEAKTTKFFTFQGQVVEKVAVEDHATQLSAVDKILSMAGVYARERDMRPPSPAIAIEVDPTTGVIRMVIGGDSQLGGPALGALASPEEPPILELPAAIGDEPVEIVRVRRGGLPADIHATLFGDD